MERFTVVALPYSRDPAEKFHVSLFISPQLEAPGGEAPLEDSATFVEWTKGLFDAEIVLSNQSGVIGAQPLLDDLKPDAWGQVFPPETPVRSRQQPDWDNRHWRTFRAAEVHDTAKLLSAVAMAFNPVSPGVPDRELDPLVALVNSRLDLPSDLSGYSEVQLTASQDERIGEPRELGGDTTPLSAIEKRIGATRGIERAFLELHRARRFYERPESQTAVRARPIEGATRDPLPRPDPDFHERVSLLGDHPGVLRKLGLVIDLRVDDLDLLAESEWLTAKISTDHTVSLTSRTACAVSGASMVTVPRTEEWVAGRLVVGDARLFGVLDMDADGAALKTDRFLWTIPRLLHTVENKGEATTATPAMRTGGFTVVHHNRALETQGRIATQGSMGQNVLGGGAPLLNTEDVTQGYRVEVLDETVGKWATLHARRVDAEVLDHGTVFDDVLDEGFVQSTTASETPGVDQSPVHVHEAMFSWGGWSLSAPRPGKRVRHEAGEEIVEDPDLHPDPITPIVLHSRVEPGTLPRLRYGRSYAFRVWGVDLAGNSRPHDMVPPSPPQPFINQVAAVVDGLGGRGAPVGLDTDLRDLTTVSVIRRRNLPDTRVVRELTDSAPLTGNTAVDASVFTRLQERRAAPKTRMGRSETLAAIDRASLVERAFEELILDGDSPFLIEPVKFDPGVIAGGIDVVPELDPKTALSVTELRPFLRWEPVQPPTVVARHSNSAGESLLQLVIRSGVIQDPDTLEIEVIPPEQYAAEHAGHRYRAKSERHLVPPKSSQYESELHGAFDTAIGSLNAADHKKLLAIAVREAGTLFDVDMPRLDDPNMRDPQPGIALVSDPGVPPTTLKTLPLAAGEPPAPGQYIVHDVDQVRVPYLPDPAAHGISLVFQDAGRDRQLLFPFGTEGFTARYGGTWPERNAFRVLLETAVELEGRLTGHALHIGLPPGDVQRFRLSSSLRNQDLDLFGFWRSLPAVIRNNADVAEAAADGWLWILTPFDKVTLVHAVPRPLEAPSPTTVRSFRVAGSTDSSLIGGVDVHGPSTEQLTAEARWTEYIDDLSLPGPESAPLNGIGFTTNIRPEEDLAVLAAATPADMRFEIPGFGPVWLHRAVHRWGDTKHRQVTYRFRASTRYREYFDPETLAPAADASPLDDGQSVVGPEVTLSVPSSARPAAPIVHSVLPLLRWDVGTEPEQPMAVRSQRQAGVRIYLERPWYSSGEGELLAVLVAPGGFDTGAENYVSQWGADPIWRSSEVPRRGMFLEFDNLIRTLGIDTRPGDARPVAPPVTMPYEAVKGSPQVTVLGYQPQYNKERGLWYVDVAIDPGDKFWPFVRLAVARYQPESVNGCHLSAPVKCDFVQLLPERIASVSRTDVRHVRVVVSGSVGTRGGGEESFPPPPLIADEAVRRNRRLVARLQRVDPNLPTDLGWDTIDTVELRLRGAGRSNTEAAWVGELASPVNIPLRKPGTSSRWRVTIEEWELLKGDPADLGERGPRVTERRLIYADELAL